MAIDFNLAQMPYSVEAEQSVLGALLIDPEKMSEVADTITPSDFYIEKNGKIFEIMLAMYVSNNKIDLVTLINEMKLRGIYDEAESKAYVLQLAEFVPTAANIKSYAQIVSEKSKLRALINASRDIAQMCVEEGDTLDVIVEAAEKRIYDIGQGRENNEFPSIVSLTTELASELQFRAQNKGEGRGVKTGFTDLDMLLGGLNNGNLIIIAARPGVGKTSLAMNIAEFVLKKKKSVAFFSLEMSNTELLIRLLSSVTGIASTRMSRGEVVDGTAEWDRMFEGISEISELKLFVNDNVALNVSGMKALLRRTKGIDLVVVDYLQLMASGSKSENRVQEVSQITRQLKTLAKELNVPVVVLSQLSRKPEDKSRKENPMPMLSDLRDSGSIEQDADVVIMLSRNTNANPGEEDYNRAKCRVAKNRHGSTGDIDLGWNGELTRFTNFSSREE